MSDDLDLIQAFMEESAELMESFEQGLLELESTPEDAEVLNRIFRAAHTIKGNSGMLGFTDVAQFTHTLEDVLDQMRKGRLRVTQEGMTLLLQSLDMLKAKLSALARSEEPSPDASALIHALQAYADEGRGQRAEGGDEHLGNQLTGRPGESGSPDPLIAGLPSEQSEEGRPKLGEILVGENLATPDDISSALKKQRRIGEILVDDALVTPAELADALGKQKRIGEILVEEKVVAPEDMTRALEKQIVAPSRADAVSIRVQTEKVDKLINLVGEMVITQSMLTQIVSKFTLGELPRLTDAVTAMERHSRELQERVMAVRMQPIKTVFSRFPRLVRDLAQTMRKQIRLEVTGEETELDKTVIDRIGDPLTHLVRNSVDHGIETPDLRRQCGKPMQGVVRLHAFHQGGSVFIEVEDDGKGLDKERILHKAVEAGLAKEGERLTDEQVTALIFRPGFSTAEQVTDVSGRGVGMDVVRKNMEALGGQVSIKTHPGRGSKFTIKLPLTLAILDGLSVQVGHEIYIIPLVNIAESLRPKPSQVQTIVGQGEVVDVRGHALPILRLYQLLGVTPRVTNPTESLLVIVENGQERVAILVDELLGQHQVVIKSLESNYRKVPGVSGATIMGDGRVALILDVRGLIRLSAERQAIRLAA